MKKLMWLIAVGLVLVTAELASVFLLGPRMRVQPNIRTYDAQMPAAPSNSVPLTTAWQPAPGAGEAARLVNPVPDTEDSRQRGRVYYEYYCLACHGTAGDGAGPVGESYVPAPADLRAAVPGIASDGELLRRMLTGTGHQPVLERVVRPEHRWYLIRYLRHLEPSPPAQ